jgi:aryl-alcohol dehydrogenase-like predicted oxidoreductase
VRSRGLSQNVIAILGAHRMNQFEDNLAAAEITLSPERLRKLDEVSEVELCKLF